MRLHRQVLVLGITLTVVTGLLCVLFPKCPLWAPGIVAAFVIYAGLHESVLSSAWFLSIAAVVNLAAYSLLSWFFLLILRRMRRTGKGPKGTGT
jgi:small-conductance mechanosensitive channel